MQPITVCYRSHVQATDRGWTLSQFRPMHTPPQAYGTAWRLAPPPPAVYAASSVGSVNASAPGITAAASAPNH